ncbi:hypothetical protein DUNSADRAFT_6920 [Dunaliella salina]|uniref:Coproporphyrinogen oxidase n=1 Tax=Dunaliella salina TaxID=3046 RepID=A0ABQ7FTL9_DUNSA|nr:hypothetical protein DUNSADRAFT_6920 [Dunaliella salina]|eukprot:KAF5825794.1 hypothetical protein DUNSADRAFT_6920 [Dunaliella salina]
MQTRRGVAAHQQPLRSSKCGVYVARLHYHPARALRTCVAASNVDFAAFTEYVTDTQQRIIAAAEHLEGTEKNFLRDRWQRDARDPNAGWGSTCVLEGGSLLEKAAVNSTVVRGILSPARAQAMCSRSDPKPTQEPE